MAPYYRNPPNQADWIFWVKMPHVELWQAIALSMGFEPGDDYPEFSSAIRGGTHEKDFDRRFQLAEAHVRNSSLKLFAWPRNARIEHALVDLRTFGAFAKRIDIQVPSDLPLDPVNWDQWGRMDTAELWQAVALSVGQSPDGVNVENAASLFGRDYEDCLKVALNCLDRGLPVAGFFQLSSFSGDNRELARRLEAGPITMVRATVRLTAYREWAEGKGYRLPPRFPQDKKTEPGKPQPANLPPETKSKWPWGSHETKLLQHLATAGEIWQTKYDPKFPATAPTNEDIELFLEQRGVAKRVRQVMAQILRADNLPSGPRVNR